MHIAEVVTIAKSLPLLRLNTYKSLILSYSADYRRIFPKKLPFYYSGKSSTNSHAWVLDGWLLRERRVITRYAFLPTQYHTESKEFVHANFGWGGQKDGYYTFNAFYTDRGPVSPQSIEDRDYDHDFSAVTYNLSK